MAFDSELTGIKKPEDVLFDLPCERYQKMKKAANKYNLIQVGLCLFFKKDDEYLTYKLSNKIRGEAVQHLHFPAGVQGT